MIPFPDLLVAGNIAPHTEPLTDKYHVLFNNSSDAIVVFQLTDEGLPGQFTEVNDAACRMYQYTREEFLTLSPKDLDSPEGWKQAPENVQKLEQKGRVQFEQRHIRKDGISFPVEIHANFFIFQDQRMCISMIRDSTERKKAEEKINSTLEDLNQLQKDTHATNNLLHAVLESPENMVIFALDSQYRYLTFNENHRHTMEQIWGVAIETGVSMLDYIGDPGDRKKAKQNFDRALAGKSFTLLEEYGDVAHDRRWYENKYDPIIDEDGTIIGLTLFLADITDRKQAEEALRESEERFRTYFESSPNGIFLADAQGHYTKVNPAACTLMGYSEDELLSRSIPDILDPSFRESGIQSFQTLLETGHSNGEFIFVRKNSKQIFLLVDAVQVGPNEFIAFCNDITDRKKAESALASEKETIESILSSLPGIFYILNKEGKPIRWNTNVETITGYTHEEIAGMNAIDLIAERDRKQVCEVIKNTFLSQQSGVDESSIVTKNGTEIPFFFSNTIKEIDNESLFVGMGLDLSERKKMEEALREVNKKLNILSSITRHDIINQVTAAEMYLDIMEMEGEIEPGSKTAEDLKMVSDALSTIERQIVFTRDYQDLGIHAPDWQNVGLLIDERTATLSEKLTVQNNVKNLEIYADPLFEKVIFNLFDNAVRHGKTITTLRFTSEETNGALTFICEDDGVGVPADVKEKIFNRQYYQHTGLGLFLSRDILSITGMTISETGVPGEGARFEILVPDGMWRKSKD